MPNLTNARSTTLTGVGGTGLGLSQGAIGVTLSEHISWDVHKNPSGKKVWELPHGDPILNVTGRIKINDEFLDERLARIEDLLHIPQRNVMIENEHVKLKKLWQEYNDTLAAIKTWNLIKDSK